jgi:hypothetical protein
LRVLIEWIAHQENALSPLFQDFYIPLEPLLPEAFPARLTFRIEARNDAGDREMAFANLRIYGTLAE